MRLLKELIYEWAYLLLQGRRQSMYQADHGDIAGINIVAATISQVVFRYVHLYLQNSRFFDTILS